MNLYKQIRDFVAELGCECEPSESICPMCVAIENTRVLEKREEGLRARCADMELLVRGLEDDASQPLAWSDHRDGTGHLFTGRMLGNGDPEVFYLVVADGVPLLTAESRAALGARAEQERG